MSGYDPAIPEKASTTIRSAIDFLTSKVNDEKQESSKYSNLANAVLRSMAELEQMGFPKHELPSERAMQLADKLASAQDNEIAALQEIGRMLERLKAELTTWKEREQANYNLNERNLTPELARKLGVPLPSPGMLDNPELTNQILTFLKSHNGAETSYIASFLSIPHVATVAAILSTLERQGLVKSRVIMGSRYWYSAEFRESEESQAHNYNPNDIMVMSGGNLTRQVYDFIKTDMNGRTNRDLSHQFNMSEQDMFDILSALETEKLIYEKPIGTWNSYYHGVGVPQKWIR